MGTNLSLDISIEGVPEVAARLEDMRLRATNFRPVFWEARERLERANAENFTSSGLPVGGWAPRSQPAAWPLMVRTGRLFESLTNLSGPPNEIGRESATFGTTVEYAKFHQYGTFKMPKRQIVFEPEGFAKAVADDAVNYIVGLGAFFK